MFLKIIGAFMIIASTSLFGYTFKLDCKKRCRSLDNMITCMKLFETEIRCNMNDILVSVKKVLQKADVNNSFIFQTFLYNAENSNGKPLSEIWGETMASINKNTIYSKNELDIFSQFGLVLGSGDVTTQIENIENLENNINAILTEAKNKTQKTYDVFSKLGVYAGILIIIFLI